MYACVCGCAIQCRFVSGLNELSFFFFFSLLVQVRKFLFLMIGYEDAVSNFMFSRICFILRFYYNFSFYPLFPIPDPATIV